MHRLLLALFGIVAVIAAEQILDSMSDAELAQFCVDAHQNAESLEELFAMNEGLEEACMQLLVDVQETPAKRKNEFIRFGKRKNEFIRFGKKKNEFIRFGKRAYDDSDEMPEKKKNMFIRFGKKKNEFIRFGKRAAENIDEHRDKKKNEFIRFGKKKNEFIRFG